MKQWVIKKGYGNTKYEVWEYITDINEARQYWYVAQAIDKYGVDKIMPIAMNRLGGYHPLRPDDPDIIKIVYSEEEPDLSVEEEYNINSPDFNCGWIAPDCTTFSCGYMEHTDLAIKLMEKYYGEVNDYLADDKLIFEKGWVKLLTGGRWLGILHKMTDDQMRFIEAHGWKEL